MQLRRTFILPLTLFVAICCGTMPGDPDATTAAAPHSDAPAPFRNRSSNAETLRFSLAGHTFPVGGHVQGIQLRHDAEHAQSLFFLSHDSNTEAYFVVAAIAADDPANDAGKNRVVHVQMLPSDGQQPPLRHAGGIQRVGDLLAVGVEDNQDKLRSEVQFWNIADPFKPAQLRHLTILRHSERPKDMTAGAVGLAEREKDFLLAVANWDSRNIDFYQSSSKQLDDPDCRFRFVARWDAPLPSARPGKSLGSYQAINLFADEKATGGSPKLYLLGFETTAANVDVIDLFAVDLNESKVELRPLDQRELKLTGDHHFRFGGGAAIEGGAWEFLGSPSRLTPQTTISLFR